MSLINREALIKKAYDEAKGMAEPYDDFGVLVEWLVDKLPSAQSESCEDTVSRKKMFEVVTEYRNQLCEIFGDENELIRVVDIVKHRLIVLPSAQPEPHWIPVSEKAHPDLPVRVQVQMSNGWIITAYYQDGDWLSVPNYGDVICDEWIEAWRELPEPYRKEGEK